MGAGSIHRYDKVIQWNSGGKCQKHLITARRRALPHASQLFQPTTHH